MTTGTPEQPNPYAVELALAAALARVVDAQDADITRAWATAWSEVSAELLDILAVILSDAGRVNASAVVRYERLARVLGGIADRLDELAGGLVATVTNDLAEVIAQAKLGTVELIAAQRLARTVPGAEVPPAALDAIVRRTTQQVTSLAQPLADETYAIVLRELTRGVAAGDNPRETAARMVERAENLHNFGRSRAVTIARTETLDAYRDGARVTQDAHADVLAGWAWIAHLGPRTCRSCLAMHGQMFDLDVAGPDDHQQGRCARVPVVREEDGSVDLSWVPSAEEHFARLPRTEQERLLGRKGYAAWVAGDFPIQDWTKTRHTTGWRDSQVPATPGDPASNVDRAVTGSGGSGTPPIGRTPANPTPADGEPRSIRESFNIVDDEVQDTLDDVADWIDGVHLTPATTQVIDVKLMSAAYTALSPATAGFYVHVPGFAPELQLRSPILPMSKFTTVHELGHAVDDLVLGTGRTNLEGASRLQLGGDLAPWWAAVQSSRSYQGLAAMGAWDEATDGDWVRFLMPNGDVRSWSPTPEHCEYLLRPQEILARAYAQWIIQENGPSPMLLALETRMGRLKPGFVAIPSDRFPIYPEQWELDDFEPIAEELRRLFESRGLLVEETP